MGMPPRDSWVWWFGIITSAIVAITANLDMFPWLPDNVKHALSIATFLIGATSAKMATSPRPSRRQQKRDIELEKRARIARNRRLG